MKQNVLSEKNGFLIRKACVEDATDYYEQNYCPLDSELARLTGCKEIFTKDNRYFYLIIAPDRKIVGESIISDIDLEWRCAHFRIAIYHAADRGNGIGTWATEVTRDFAFAELKLHRLELEVYSFNSRAEKTYLKAGFKREGVKRDAVIDGDKYADIILMSILENEWKILKDIQ